MAQRAQLALSVLLGLVFLARVGLEIRRNSPTYDEPYFVAAGYANLTTGDFRLRKDKPVLVPDLLAAPLVGSGVILPRSDPSWSASASARPEELRGMDDILNFALVFLHHNARSAAEIIRRSRAVSAGCGLALVVLVGLFARRLYGPWAGLLAAFLCSFDPAILAHSGLATEDIFLTTFFFCGVAGASIFFETPSIPLAVFTGLSVAAALLSKYTAVLLPPLIVLLAVTNRNVDWEWLRRNRRPVLAAISSGVALFLFVYRGTHLAEYWRGLMSARAYISQSQTAFLAGRYSGKGFLFYFPAAVLLKTPLSLLAAVTAAAFPLKLMLERDRRWMLIPVVVLLGAASLSPMQIGHRHILPIYPFLFVFAASLSRRRGWALAAALLVPVFAVESASAGAENLSYFNALAGGAERGWRYLVDSNIDWGQDLGALRTYVREAGNPEVVLSYFGSSVPEAVGFEFQDLYSFGVWGKKDHVNSASPKRELLAVSVTNLQGVYLLPVLGEDGMAWLRSRKPTASAGYSIKIYDITDDSDAHAWLAHMYLAGGFPLQARREAQRALAIDPGNTWARLLETIFTTDPERISGVLSSLAGALHNDPLMDKIPWPKAITLAAIQQTYGGSMTAIGNEYLRRRAAEPGTLLCQKAAQIDPRDPKALECLLNGLTMLGRRDAAADVARKLSVLGHP
jgi:hypothetical protein